MHFKFCKQCGVAMTKDEGRISESAWQAKTFCSDLCRMRLRRGSKLKTPKLMSMRDEPLIDLGDDDERIPQETLDGIEARKAEVRQNQLRGLIAAGGGYEAE